MDTKTAENYLPAEGKDWEFNEEVTSTFDNMLTASIPGYESMRRFTDMFIERHVEETVRAHIVDIGASRGEAVARVIDTPENGATFSLIEVSPPMRNVLQDRWGDQKPRINIMDMDIRYNHPRLESMCPTLVVSALTTIFTPISHRQAIVSSIRKALSPRNGTFIWIEKILGTSAAGDQMLTTEYYKFKQDNGYTHEAITRKKLSLEFAQTPLAAEWNEQILREAGFSVIQRYWTCLNFAAWICKA